MALFKNIPYTIERTITNRMLASVAISPTGTLIPFLGTGTIDETLCKYWATGCPADNEHHTRTRKRNTPTTFLTGIPSYKLFRK